MYVCMYVYIYIYTHTHTHTHIYIYIYIYIYTWSRLHVCIYINVSMTCAVSASLWCVQACHPRKQNKVCACVQSVSLYTYTRKFLHRSLRVRILAQRGAAHTHTHTHTYRHTKGKIPVQEACRRYRAAPCSGPSEAPSSSVCVPQAARLHMFFLLSITLMVCYSSALDVCASECPDPGSFTHFVLLMPCHAKFTNSALLLTVLDYKCPQSRLGYGRMTWLLVMCGSTRIVHGHAAWRGMGNGQAWAWMRRHSQSLMDWSVLYAHSITTR